MKNKNIKRIFYITILTLTLTVTACNKADNKKNIGSSVTNSEENSTESNENSQENVAVKSNKIQDSVVNTDESSGSTSETDTESVEPTATKEISIYTMNETSLEVESVTALVPEKSEITPQLIVNLVADSLADRLVTVGIDNVTTEGDTVIVSFLSNQPPLTNVGSGLEETILTAFAQSLVDNLKDKYPKVIFRQEGKAYSSGHFEFGINEVYLDGNLTN
jgi:hypothetical protein